MTGKRRALWIAAIVLSIGIAAVVVAAQTQTASEWVCPPCGCSDHEIKSEPGTCPVCRMTLIDKADLLDLAVVVYPQFSLSETLATMSALQAAGEFFSFTVAAETELVLAREQIKVQPAYRIGEHPEPAVLVLSGGSIPPDLLESETFMTWLKQTAARADRVVGIGLGSILLFKAGLLDGAEVAVSANTKRLLERFDLGSDSKLLLDKSWVESGRFISIADHRSGVDAALEIVSDLLGRGTARRAAQRVGRPDWTPGN